MTDARRVVSWARNAEDIVLRRAFSGRTAGFYVDIGAASPERDSITRMFFDIGWTGVHVAADLAHADALRRARPHDTVLDPNTEVQARYPVLLQTCGGLGPAHIEFLRIGFGWPAAEIVAGGDWQRFRPAVVLLEVGEPNGAAEAQRLLRDVGYHSVLFDGINQFFVAEEHAAIEPLVGVPANVLDAFDSYICADQLAAAGAEIERLRGRETHLDGALRTMTSNAGTHAAERKVLVAQRDTAQRENEQLRHELARCRAEFAQFVEYDALLARVRRRATVAARSRAATLLGRVPRA